MNDFATTWPEVIDKWGKVLDDLEAVGVAMQRVQTAARPFYLLVRFPGDAEALRDATRYLKQVLSGDETPIPAILWGRWAAALRVPPLVKVASDRGAIGAQKTLKRLFDVQADDFVRLVRDVRDGGLVDNGGLFDIMTMAAKWLEWCQQDRRMVQSLYKSVPWDRLIAGMRLARDVVTMDLMPTIGSPGPLRADVREMVGWLQKLLVSF